MTRFAHGTRFIRSTRSSDAVEPAGAAVFARLGSRGPRRLGPHAHDLPHLLVGLFLQVAQRDHGLSRTRSAWSRRGPGASCSRGPPAERARCLSMNAMQPRARPGAAALVDAAPGDRIAGNAIDPERRKSSSRVPGKRPMARATCKKTSAVTSSAVASSNRRRQ